MTTKTFADFRDDKYAQQVWHNLHLAAQMLRKAPEEEVSNWEREWDAAATARPEQCQ